MAHTKVYIPAALFGLYTITIQDYASGGEAFTLAEFNLSTPPIVPVINPSIRNSLNAVLFPIIQAGQVRLFRVVGGVLAEIASTPGLNAIFDVAIIASTSN